MERVNKNDFIKKAKAIMVVTNYLIQVRDISYAVIKEMDGKVITKAIATKISKRIPANLPVCVWYNKEKWSSPYISLRINSNDENRCWRLGNGNLDYVDIDFERKVIYLEDTNDDGRLNAAKTIERGPNHLNRTLNEYLEAVNNFDKYLKMSEEIDEALNKYRKECIPCLRYAFAV